MKVLKGFVSNYACPEGSIANCYLSLECLCFCETFLKQSDKQIGCANVRDDAILEDHPISVGKCIKLDHSNIAIEHNYVLFNLEIIAPYLK